MELIVSCQEQLIISVSLVKIAMAIHGLKWPVLQLHSKSHSLCDGHNIRQYVKPDEEATLSVIVSVAAIALRRRY